MGRLRLNTARVGTIRRNFHVPPETPERNEVSVDLADVSKLDVEPGELPEKMAAWVIRPETEGNEPNKAFQLEDIETGFFFHFTDHGSFKTFVAFHMPAREIETRPIFL